MGYDLLLDIIEKIGHTALFFVLCLGLIGLPIPNEAVALTGGALSEAGVLHPWLALIMISLGICSAMTFNYAIGRFTSSALGKWFSKKQNLGKFMDKSQQLIHKYGLYAVPISAFFPFLRHATPYVLGMNGMRFLKFMLVAYPTAFVWSTLFYTLGHFVGDQIPDLIKVINRYESLSFIFLIIVVCLIITVYWLHMRQRRKKRQSDLSPPI